MQRLVVPAFELRASDDPSVVKGSADLIESVQRDLERTISAVPVNSLVSFKPLMTVALLAGCVHVTTVLWPKMPSPQITGGTDRPVISAVQPDRSTIPADADGQRRQLQQGRVWTGAQAKERGLGDVLGGLDTAVKSGARRASLGDDFRVEYIEHEPRGLDRYLSLLFGRLGAALRDDFGWVGLARALIDALPPRTPRELALLLQTKDQPSRALSYCFCDVR